jgi:hypothetical protein
MTRAIDTVKIQVVTVLGEGTLKNHLRVQDANGKIYQQHKLNIKRS